MNIYETITKLDEAVARTHAIILNHADVKKVAKAKYTERHGNAEAEVNAEKILWSELRRSVLEADNLMRDLLVAAKCPDPMIKDWERRRGYIQ